MTHGSQYGLKYHAAAPAAMNKAHRINDPTRVRFDSFCGGGEVGGVGTVSRSVVLVGRLAGGSSAGFREGMVISFFARTGDDCEGREDATNGKLFLWSSDRLRYFRERNNGYGEISATTNARENRLRTPLTETIGGRLGLHGRCPSRPNNDY